MLALRRVAPERFSEFSAAFDASNGRFLWEYLLGYPIAWFGYDATHTVARLTMAICYAGAIGFLLNTLRLSALDGLLVIGLFLISGQDILGKEWLFRGVEGKTVAYALVIVGLAFVMRGRAALAVCLAAAATYFHFLVGGFWLIALVAFDAIRDYAPSRQLRLTAIGVILVFPLVALIAYQQLVSLHVPAHEPSASYIYSILRAPHHGAPFSSGPALRMWAPDIALLLALSLSFFYLARSDFAKSRPLVPWVTGLLCFLLIGLILSALDAKTGYLGKFYLFRPSSLTLFCVIVVIVAMVNELAAEADIKQRLRYAAFLFVMPLALFGVANAKMSELSVERRAVTEDIARMNKFIVGTTAPDDIVLIQPDKEYEFPVIVFPLLLDRPTLVSFKAIPSNARDIYRWYDLLKYRNSVFREECRGIDRFPVRYLLMTQRPGLKVPCGKVIWTSDNFVLVEP